ncbi:MAG: DUF7657 domain-containing protein [Thermoleophilia bacterium]
MRMHMLKNNLLARKYGWLRLKLDRWGARFSEEQLIRFDHRSLLFIMALAAVFVLLTATGIHRSSVGVWNSVVAQRGMDKTGLLMGEPRGVRSDEWLGYVPWLLSQSHMDFPESNPDVGAHNDPLMLSMPVKDFFAFFRPQNWGYFIFDLAHGFSFYWSFKVIGLTFSFFMLLMLLTCSDFWLSAIGSGWIYLTGFVQWWLSTTLPEMLTAFCLAFIALAYLLLTRRQWLAAVSAAALMLFAVDFVLFFYPPFQIPLVFLFIFMLAGFVLRRGKIDALRHRLWRRLALLGAAVAAGAGILGAFYLDTRTTIAAIAATAYPGNRLSNGGEIGLLRTMDGFFAPLLGATRYPVSWANICEASNFMLFFPAVVIVSVRDRIRRLKLDPLVTSLCIFLLGMFVWTAVGLPAWLARLTLLSYVPSSRSLLALGTGSIIAVMVFLSGRRQGPRSGRRMTWAAGTLILAALIVYSLELRASTDDYFSLPEVVLIAAVFAGLFLLLMKRRWLLFSLLLLPVLASSSLTANPVAFGLGPITGKQAYQAAEQINAANPGLKWAVYGNGALPAFLEAAGMHVIDGIRYTPDMTLMRTLDPDGRYSVIYNRYANIELLPTDPEQRRERFTLIQPDAYILTIDPCAPELAAAGVDGFVFTYKPNDSQASCLRPVAAVPASHVWFYLRR